MVEFKDRLKDLLDEKKIKQKSLAKRIPISEQSISKWINGGQIKSEYIPILASIFGVSTDYLLGVSDAKHPKNESLMKETHLSEDAIETLKYESSENGNNTRIVLLDWILSDRETFSKLMDNLFFLCFPPATVISVEDIPKPLLDSTGKHIILKPELIMHLSKDTPERIHNRINEVLDDFAKKHVNDTIPCPNEWHPI